MNIFTEGATGHTYITKVEWDLNSWDLNWLHDIVFQQKYVLKYPKLAQNIVQTNFILSCLTLFPIYCSKLSFGILVKLKQIVFV